MKPEDALRQRIARDKKQAGRPLNTPHTITIGPPLLRPGLTISATCSEGYVVPVTRRLMALLKEFNG